MCVCRERVERECEREMESMDQREQGGGEGMGSSAWWKQLSNLMVEIKHFRLEGEPVKRKAEKKLQHPKSSLHFTPTS